MDEGDICGCRYRNAVRKRRGPRVVLTGGSEWSCIINKAGVDRDTVKRSELFDDDRGQTWGGLRSRRSTLPGANTRSGRLPAFDCVNRGRELSDAGWAARRYRDIEKGSLGDPAGRQRGCRLLDGQGAHRHLQNIESFGGVRRSKTRAGRSCLAAWTDC